MAGEPIQRNEILVAYKQKEYREKMKRDGSGMEQKTYILLNAGGTEINGTDQSRGNGSKKSADSTDGAMLLPETCEECCGETHGLYHYVSEKICELPTEPNPIWNRCISICGRNMKSKLNPAGIRSKRHFHRKRCRRRWKLMRRCAQNFRSAIRFPDRIPSRWMTRFMWWISWRDEVPASRAWMEALHRLRYITQKPPLFRQRSERIGLYRKKARRLKCWWHLWGKR